MTRPSILDPFAVVLLDLNATFMFGGDRFGADHDYHATYQADGGRTLSSSDVRQAVDACYAHLAARYNDPAFVDDFPGVAETLAYLPETHTLPDDERGRLERVITAHELGRVPDDHAAALRRLARTHRLGLVSNIWSRKAPWVAELGRAGVVDLFDVLVFSSDSRSMKPSPRLFEIALAAFDAPRERVVVVGDSLRADIAPARALGLASIWINAGGTPVPLGDAAPDYIVSDLLELLP